MAGSQREFELLFKLKASLGGGFNSTFKNAIDTNKKLQDSLKSVNSLQSKIDGYTKQASAIDKNKEKLQALTQEHDKLQRELNETQEPSEALRKKLEKNENQIQQTTAKIEDQTKKLNNLGGELKKAGISTDNLENANTKLQKSYDKLKTSQERLQKINAEQEKVNQNISKTKTQLIGVAAVAATVSALFYAGPITKAADFEAKMSDVKAISGATAEDMKLLSNKAKQMGKDTVFTAVEAGKAMEYMAMAGWKTKDMLTSIDGIMSLAAASGEDLALVSDIVTDAMTAMGLAADGTTKIVGANGLVKEVKNATHFADVLAAASSNSNTNVALLGESFRYCAPLAGAFKFNIEDTAFALGLMANSGIKASQSGTAFRKILAQLSSDFSIVQKDGSEFVVSTTKSDGTMRSLKDILDDTRKAFNGMTDAEKEAAQGNLKEAAQELEISLKKENGKLKTQAELYAEVSDAMNGLTEAGKVQEAEGLAGKTAMAGLLAVVNSAEGDYDKLATAIYNCDGAAKEMEQIKLDNYKGQLALAKSATDALQMALGEAFLPTVTSGLKQVTQFVNKIAEWAQENPKTVQTIGKVAAGLLALKVGFLTTRLGVLSIQKDFLFVQGIFAKFAGKTAIAEAASIGLGGKLTNAGKGILNYFGSVKGAMGGVSNAIGKTFTNSPILTKVSGFVGGINSKIITGLSGIAGKAAGVLTGAGSKMVGFLLKPFLSIGGRLGGILSNVGGIILKSPLGTIGRVLASGFSSFGTLLAPIGNLLKTTFAPLARLGTTLLGPLGGIAGKLFPIIGVVTLVITVFELVRKNLDKIREAIRSVFGDKGVEVFNKVVAVITNIGNAIKGVFSDGNIGAARDKINEIFGEKGVVVFDVFVKAFEKIKTAAGQFVNFVITHIVPVAEDVLNLITTSIIPGIVKFVQAAAPTIMSIIQSVANFIGAIIPVIGSFIAGLMPVISGIIAFIQDSVLPIIGKAFGFITGTVLPMIAAGIQSILPIVTNILSTLLPFIQTAVTTIWNIVQPIIQGILAAIQFAMPTIQAIIQNVIGTVTGIIHGLMTVLGGIITFITGVFTGNWSQAWEGIKSIFSGIWEGISSICKGVINGIITAVNVVIRGLNKLKVPDWVPGLGGKGINIAEIQMLAKGTRRTPETFIAGEEGPEIITNSPGRTVFTANQTKRILESQNAANETAAAVKGAPGITNVTNNSQSGPQTVNNYGSAPEVVSTAGKGAGNKNITITNSPTIIVEGNKPDDLDAKLAQNNADLLKQVENLLDKKDDDERRSKYD